MAKTSKASTADASELDFEAALNQLQEIVERMESNEQSLEASIKDYELGSSLATQCQKRLDEAQLKVETLTKIGSGYQTDPLNSDD
jgi:exodeoxyribonuclease VII small subunit